MQAHRFPAMGTSIHVLLPGECNDAIVLVRDLFADWEATLSRFRPESELSRLNERPGERVSVGSLLFRVVSAAIEAARATHGLFDPTLLRQLVRIGYERSFDEMPVRASPAVAPAERGGRWSWIELDARERTIRLPEGCAIDLGGIAKGMAVDAALDLLGGNGVSAALVSAGGDLAVSGLPPDTGPWPVLVGDDPARQVLPLVRGALATSGVSRRSWSQGELRRHHILDPRTGESAESGLREVTVAARTCRVAEVAATTAFVLGPRAGANFLWRNGLAARLTRDDSTHVVVGSWPAPMPSAA
jgi:thiamine biosynthesis lipoprotein